MFYDEIQKYDWDETSRQIMAKTDADVGITSRRQVS